MSAQEPVRVPPNGKWGWMIVLANALNGISTVSILQGFGLIFKDTFPRFGFSATEGAIIINTNLAFGMILGLINGPLLRKFGYRKIAVFGSLLYALGVTMTAFVKTFPLIMISYGIFASLGICITMASFSYALNSYFTSKRGRATSLALTIVSLGPILLPQVTTFLISFYGFQGTILLYGAFSLHSLVGSMLLQPLKWHTKIAKDESNVANEKAEKNEEENKLINEKSINFQEKESMVNSVQDLNIIQRRRRTTISSIDHDAEIGSIYGFDVSFTPQLSETFNDNRNKFKSIDTINLGSSIKIFDEKSDSLIKYSTLSIFEEDDCNLQNTMENGTPFQKRDSKVLNVENYCNEKCEKKPATSQVCKKISQIFDLDLLRDPIYVNIMLGMSIAIFAEINFSQLLPFILTDMSLSTKKIANVMSVVAMVDLVFRSLAPFLGEWLRQPPRIMYLLSLCLLIVSRSCLLFVNGYLPMMFVAVALGAAKGIRSVYMCLVIPHYVSIDKLPNASGIQMISNGIILLTTGPMLGLMRDNFGNYTPCIIMLNCITALTVGLWLIEMLVLRRRKLRLEKQEDTS